MIIHLGKDKISKTGKLGQFEQKMSKKRQKSTKNNVFSIKLKKG